MKRFTTFAAAAVVALVALPHPRAAAQATYTWAGTSAGAWLAAGNWAGGPAGTYPGASAAPGSGASTDIARFTNATASVGIDMGPACGTLSVGAINFQSATGPT